MHGELIILAFERFFPGYVVSAESLALSLKLHWPRKQGRVYSWTFAKVQYYTVHFSK
jgi:hypothetical protein